MKTKKSFTLVEMLVVIGVVGALAAVTLPVLSSARKKAREMTCMNNLRQLGTAYIADSMEKGANSVMYSEFNNNTNYPTMIRVPAGPTNLGRLHSDLKSLDVLGCPEAEPYNVNAIASAWNSDANVVFTSFIPRNAQQGASPNQELNGFPRADGNTAIVADYNRTVSPARESLRRNTNHRGQVVHYATLGGGAGSLDNENGELYIQSFNDLPRFWRAVDAKVAGATQ